MANDLSHLLSMSRRVWDGTVTVKLRVVRADGDRDFLVHSAKQHMVSIREAEESGGAYTTQDCTWNLTAAESLYDPEVGYVLIETEGDDIGKQWTILQADRAAWKTRHRCTCRDMGLTAGLSDTIEIWSPTNRKDAAGSKIGEYLPKHMGVQAKVQEIRGDAASESGQTGTTLEYRVFVGRRLYVTNDDQLRVRLGPGEPHTILEIVSHDGVDSLTRLQTLVCRRGLW